LPYDIIKKDANIYYIPLFDDFAHHSHSIQDVNTIEDYHYSPKWLLERTILSDIKIDPSTLYPHESLNWIHRFLKNIGLQIDQLQSLIGLR